MHEEHPINVLTHFYTVRKRYKNVKCESESVGFPLLFAMLPKMISMEAFAHIRAI